MALSLVQKPAATPISLTQAKAHLRVEHNEEDVLISELIVVAADYVERMLGQKLITQVWRQYVDCPQASGLVSLEAGPAQSVVEFTGYNASGEAKIIDPANYRLVSYSTPPRVEFSGDLSSFSALNSIEIDVAFGFGDTGADIPGTLQRALFLLVAHWFEFRGAVGSSHQPISIPEGIPQLLRPFLWTRL